MNRVLVQHVPTDGEIATFTSHARRAGETRLQSRDLRALCPNLSDEYKVDLNTLLPDCAIRAVGELSSFMDVLHGVVRRATTLAEVQNRLFL